MTNDKWQMKKHHLQSNSFLSLSLLLPPRGMVNDDELRLKFTSVFASVLPLLNCNWWADWSANPLVKWPFPPALLDDQTSLLWSLVEPLDTAHTWWLVPLETFFDSLNELPVRIFVTSCCCLSLGLLAPLVIALTGTLLHCKVLIAEDSLDCGERERREEVSIRLSATVNKLSEEGRCAGDNNSTGDNVWWMEGEEKLPCFWHLLNHEVNYVDR